MIGDPMKNSESFLNEILEKNLSRYLGLSFHDLATEVGLNNQLLSGKLSKVTVVNKILKASGCSKEMLLENGV